MQSAHREESGSYAPTQSPAHTSEELLFEKASSQAAWALALHSGQSGRATPRVIEGDFPAGDPAPSSLFPEGPLLDLVWSPGPTGLGVGGRGSSVVHSCLQPSSPLFQLHFWWDRSWAGRPPSPQTSSRSNRCNSCAQARDHGLLWFSASTSMEGGQDQDKGNPLLLLCHKWPPRGKDSEQGLSFRPSWFSPKVSQASEPKRSDRLGWASPQVSPSTHSLGQEEDGVLGLSIKGQLETS